MLDRRDLMAAMMMAMMAALPGGAAAGERAMYGRVGKFKAVPGQREALVAALVAGSANMPGNRHYVIARDAADADGIWVWETWDSAAAHRASLALPQVQRAIAIGRPLIASFEVGAELVL
jgi:quinol monooxygenase YgiN